MAQKLFFYSDIVKFINKNFLIRYCSKEQPKKTYLIGAGVYHHLVGQTLANKHFSKAYNSDKGKLTFKLRRGLIIHFVSK